MHFEIYNTTAVPAVAMRPLTGIKIICHKMDVHCDKRLLLTDRNYRSLCKEALRITGSTSADYWQ